MSASAQALQTLQRDLERDKTELMQKEREVQTQQRMVEKSKADLSKEELKLTGLEHSVDEIKRRMDHHGQEFKRMEEEIKKTLEKGKK